MTAYYNEYEPFAAEWLRSLIAAGHLPDGTVDDRSIHDVQPEDLREFDQCHFFAGIGGWPLALRLAGWGDDRPVWTGSCPCQPFSTAGSQKGTADDRHLWPVWARLIRERRPSTIFGEQVPSAIAHGWLDLVFDDLEGEGYACGAIVAPACSVGAPHRRDRLWFVAYAEQSGRDGLHERQQSGYLAAYSGGGREDVSDRGASEDLSGRVSGQGARGCDAAGLGAADRGRLEVQREPQHAGIEGPSWRQPDGCGQGGRWHGQDVADADLVGSHGGRACGAGRAEPADGGGGVGAHDVALSRRAGLEVWDGDRDVQRAHAAASRGGWWSVEPDVGRVAHGVLGRVGRLRAYGNAIVPQAAAEVIAAFMECRP